jgi:cell division initiation protein
MSITALEIQEARFHEVNRGYDPNEVDEFLERVAADVDTLNRALSDAAARIKAVEQELIDQQSKG